MQISRAQLSCKEEKNVFCLDDSGVQKIDVVYRLTQYHDTKQKGKQFVLWLNARNSRSETAIQCVNLHHALYADTVTRTFYTCSRVQKRNFYIPEKAFLAQLHFTARTTPTPHNSALNHTRPSHNPLLPAIHSANITQIIYM